MIPMTLLYFGRLFAEANDIVIFWQAVCRSLKFSFAGESGIMFNAEHEIRRGI